MYSKTETSLFSASTSNRKEGSGPRFAPKRIPLSLLLLAIATFAGAMVNGCSPPEATQDGRTTETSAPPSSPRTSDPGDRSEAGVDDLASETVVSGLEFPAKMAVAPDGTIFYNELRNGRVRIIRAGKLVNRPFARIKIVQMAETGLIGITLHPDYPDTPYVYVYATQNVNGKQINRVIRFTDADGKGTQRKVIFDGIRSEAIHNGGELEFGPDGKLYITTGDSAEQELAQRKESPNGKILRLNPDGSIPSDNPFEGSPVYSLGHRNMIGLAFHPVTKNLYNTENGPDRDDEINLIEPGGNYGWPLTTGVDNSNRFVSPLITYTPNIAPTGASFISSGSQYGKRLQNRLLFGSYNTGDLHIVTLNSTGTRLDKDEIVLFEQAGIFDVTEAHSGQIFYSTSAEIKRLVLK